MALDGLCVRAIVDELNEKILGGRINKIAQPEKEELIISIRGNEGNEKLLISANASLPFIYFTSTNKVSPAVAPGFCMLLRKHISSGRIVEISQPGMERVIKFTISHLNEMGDDAVKHLYVEIMGKHSNIIFTDENDMILDSIKHVSAQVSSVREVLPGRQYFIPAQEGKVNPFEVDEDFFINDILSKPLSIAKAIYTSIIGISPVIANEIVYRTSSSLYSNQNEVTSILDSDLPTDSLDLEQKQAIFAAFSSLFDDLKCQCYAPRIYYDGEKPVDFAPIELSLYSTFKIVSYDSISALLESYYAGRNLYTVIHQKSTDLRKIVSTHLDRNRKKLALQEKQMADTEKKDKYKVYGELLHTYGYEAKEGDKSITVINYYDNKELTIPLDPELTASENAKKYFEKYNKLKRTKEALDVQISATMHDIELLESVEVSLEIAQNEADLAEIRKELVEYGFIKKHAGKKQAKAEKSKPLHYVDENGFHIYVGKNNYQNDELTFKLATGNDWWFHSKKYPGSHVIVKCEGKELPDSTFEYAAGLAAYYSKAGKSEHVEIDYLQKKNVKKPAGAVAGFVVYYTNFSMVATADISHVTLIE